MRVGLDDFAQKLLGKLKTIDPPNIGRELRQGEVGFQVRRNGETARVLSPVDGIVSHVNERLLDHPEVIHESPYEEGWLFIIEPTRLRKDLKGLHYGEEADNYLNDEREKLFSLANGDLRLAADGGASVKDIFEELEGENWAKFVRTFLRT